MKYQVTFKTPDVFYELQNLEESELDKVMSIIRNYSKYDEYITVEIDTDDETVVVVPIMQ